MSDELPPIAAPRPPSQSAHQTRRAIWAMALMVVAALAAILLASPRVEQFHLRQAGAEDTATLQLATQVLRGALERTQALPALIAQRPELIRLLEEPDNEGLVPYTNEVLRQAAHSLDVANIYVLDVNGLTVATSNYRSDHSFLGQSFEYRPYFIDTITQGAGQFHARGTTSGQRGYFFGAPILDGTELVGVVAVKLTLDRFETTWADSDATLMVTDTNNVVFMSDREDWLFRTTGPLPAATQARIAATQQYPTGAPLSFQIDPEGLAEGMDRMEVEEADGPGDYIRQTNLIAAVGWRVSILTPTGPALQRAWTVIFLACLVVVVLGLVSATILGRRARLIERLAAEQSLASLLEARVAERTTELKAEVEERRATEDRLRRTQAELVQAGKLAALGQMSAALSHEFNQPLAAVKSYAENAGAFLDRGRAEDARSNIHRISGLADRMATISKHLRNFARRPQDKTRPVAIAPIVRDALDLMAPRLREVGAEIAFDPPHEDHDPIWVRGGPVRLQQVVVNLLGNALDAMRHHDTPRIEITLTGGDTPEIAVRDRGTGLSDTALAQAFDPFFSTKDPGSSLGLGLSISYNIVRDFGGRLTAENHPEVGAIFRITLEACAAPDVVQVAAQ